MDRASGATRNGCAAAALLDHRGLNNLSCGVEHDVDQCTKWRIRVRLLRETVLKLLRGAGVRHVGEIVAHDGARRAAVGARYLLHDIAEVVDEERERGPALRDGAEQAVHGAHHRCQRTRHVVQRGDQQGVEVEGGEDAVDDVDEVAEADDQLELGLHIDDGEVDFLDREGYAGVDGDEAGDVGVEVDVRSQVFHVQINAAHGEVRHVEQNVGGS